MYKHGTAKSTLATLARGFVGKAVVYDATKDDMRETVTGSPGEPGKAKMGKWVNRLGRGMDGPGPVGSDLDHLSEEVMQIDVFSRSAGS